MKQHGYRYCPTCSNKLQKRGLTAAGTQRWYCKNCNSSNTKARPDLVRKQQLQDFVHWLLGRQTQSQMSKSVSARHFRRQTAWCWSVEPKPKLTGEIHKVIIIDGIRVGHLVCIIAKTPQHVLTWAWVPYESSKTWSLLFSRLPAPDYVVCDGQKGILLALSRCWSDTIIQRCLFHVLLNMKAKLTLNPQNIAGIELKGLFSSIWQVKTNEQADEWIIKFKTLYAKHEQFLKEKTQHPNPKTGQRRWWYTHRSVRSAYRQIDKLINDKQLFNYTEANISRTTNHLEGGINAQIRQKIRLHKGLSWEKQQRLVDWYLYSKTER